MTVNVNEVLSRLESLSKRAEAHNRKEDEIKGFKKARVQSILELSDKLKEKGVDLGLELKGETDFTAESVEKFKSIAQGIVDKHVAEADRLDEFFRAAEVGDIAKLKEITGEDLDTVDYTIEITSIEDMKTAVAETNEQILEEGITTASNTEVLSFDGSDSAEEVVEEPVAVSKDADDFAVTLDETVEEAQEETVEEEVSAGTDDADDWSAWFK